MSKHLAAGVGEVDLLATEHGDPFDVYVRARERGPVQWDTALNSWVVFDHDLCSQVLMDSEGFRNAYADAPPELVAIKGGRSNISLTQGDEHLRLRKFHLALFSRPAVQAYRDEHVVPIVHELLDRFAHRGRADLFADLAAQAPPRIIAALFGMPWRDDDLMARVLELNEQLMSFIGRNYQGEAFGRARAASDELNAILLPFIRASRDRPQGDLVGRVWLEAPAEYGEMDEETALGICREIFFGGGDTTVHGIANVLHLLLTDIGARRAAQAGDEGLTAVVEEAMRLHGSVQYRFRLANRDCEIGGVAVAKDQNIVLLHAAANRDGKHFPNPAEVDLKRRPAADHLAFGRGARACVGAGLARVEMREAARAVLSRLRNVRLDPGHEAPAFRGLFMRSYRPLHVLFDV